MTAIIGYRQGQAGGACLVTVRTDAGDEVILPLAPINPKLEFRHSPDGFQWSYSGSGPTELARAILVRFYPDDDRVRHPRCYRAFRDAFLSGLKADEFEMPEGNVRAWYDRWVRENPEIEAGWLHG